MVYTKHTNTNNFFFFFIVNNGAVLKKVFFAEFRTCDKEATTSTIHRKDKQSLLTTITQQKNWSAICPALEGFTHFFLLELCFCV
jgi:hypothetical protein